MKNLKKAQMDIQRQYQGLDMQYKSQVKNTMDKVLAEVSTEKRIICCSAKKHLVRSKWYASSKTRVCSSRRN